MNKFKTSAAKVVLALGVTVPLVLAGCSSSGDSGSSDSDRPAVVSAVALVAPKNFTEGIDWSTLPSTEVTLNDDGLEIREPGTYVLSGHSTGQVTVDTDGQVRLVLDGVSIETDAGAGIQVKNADVTVLELAEGSTNTVADAPTRDDETIDGAVFSSDDLAITGEGSLEVTGNFDDAIVSKDDLWIESGTISVTAVDDGIRGKDSLTITGGEILVDTADDGIKSTNTKHPGRGQVTITGGNITIESPDDAIDARQGLLITGGTITITGANNGLMAPVIVIDDGKITVTSSGDGVRAKPSELVTTGFSIAINGGDLTVDITDDGDDGIDSDGDLVIAGGTVDITAQSPFSVEGTAVRTGGTVTVNGKEVDELKNP